MKQHGAPPEGPERLSTFGQIAPFLFVFTWSSGWISAGFAAPHADPLTFLSVRFAFAFALIAAFVMLVRAPWPRGRGLAHAVISGVLLHGVYLAGVWWAVAQGVPAGVSGIMAGLQPVMTALAAPFILGERLSGRGWAGIALGFAGVALVLSPRFTDMAMSGWAGGMGLAIAVNFVAMISVTAGTLYQKRYVASGDLRSITALQYVGALCVTAPLALAIEPMRFDINAISLGVLAWSVVVLSIGGIGLLLYMIRRGAVTRVAAFIYLVPPTSALMAYLLLGETLSVIQMAGVVLTAAGVALATRG